MTKIIAEELAKKQQSIAVSEFFTKNRHLLGFDNPRKALLTTIKEGVDNSLDACQEARILPTVKVTIKQVQEERFNVIIEDNGPGIVKKQIPPVFARLLYGSKFFTMRQQRGQQGIGICMTPDTLIPLGDGKVLPIKEIVEKKPNADLFVLTPNLKLGLGKIDKFWKIPSPKYLINLKTIGGKEVKLTPENPVLIRSENGFEWKEAVEIKRGEYIAVSRKLGSHVKDIRIPVLDLLDEDTNIDNPRFLDFLLSKLRKKYGTWEKVGNRFGTSSERIKGWKKKSIKRRPTKHLIKKFCEDLNIPKEKIIKECTRVGKLGTYVNIPLYIDEDFMRFLGFISRDGYSQNYMPKRWGRNISFWNNNKHLRGEFKNLVENLFRIKCKCIKHSKGKGCMMQFSSSLVARLINKCGIPSGKKSGIFRLNSFLHRRDLLRPYLQALFDCEGSVSKQRKNINFMIRNKEMTSYISLFLLQFGIISSINRLKEDTRLCIRGINNLKRFQKEINFSHPVMKSDLDYMVRLDSNKSNLETVPFIKKQLVALKDKLGIQRKDFPYPHLLTRNKTVNFYTLKDLVDKILFSIDNRDMAPIELQELYCLLNSDVVWTKIISIKIVSPNSPYVYDMTMKQGNNFIANGILVHNSAAVLYSQLTTGKPAKITSKISPKLPAHYYELRINTKLNEPEILVDKEVSWEKEHGTKVDLEMEAIYQKGGKSVDDYLKQTSIANPHAEIIYVNPENQKTVFPRASNELPKESKEIKPHPHGIELGIFISMLNTTKSKTLSSFLTNDFIRISSNTAKKISEEAQIKTSTHPDQLSRDQSEKMYNVIQKTRLIAPPTNCLSPIGAESLQKSLEKEIPAEFFASVTRPAAVYRGNPFQIEVSCAYGGQLDQEGPIKLLRFANRVPLQYQQSACAITKSILETNWRNYNLSQSRGALPVGPVVLAIHMASVWVPFTSESKEAIAHYPEIIKEIKLAVQEVGRKIASHIRRTVRVREQKERASLFEKYIPEISYSLSKLTKENKKEIEEKLNKMLKKSLKDLIPEQPGEDLKQDVKKEERQTTLGTRKARK